MPLKQNASRTKNARKNVLPREPQRKNSSEHLEQVAVIQWRNLMVGAHPELRWLMAIPNGAKLPYRRTVRSGKVISVSPERSKLIAEGLLPGASDLFLPVHKTIYHGLWIEMKYGTNTTTPEQDAFLSGMIGNSYAVAVCWCAEEAIKVISDYLGIEQWKET